jgi:hypothetical protein
MTRAADYVVALRTAASGSSTKAASNTYVKILLANTNSYIAATAATVTAADAEHDLGTLIALGLG